MMSKIAHAMAHWMGTSQSFVLHSIGFLAAIIACFYFNYMVILLLVTTIVSLEAIYQGIFLQMIMNEHKAEMTQKINSITETVEELNE